DPAVLDAQAGRLHAFRQEHALGPHRVHLSLTIFAAPAPRRTRTAKTCQLYWLPYVAVGKWLEIIVITTGRMMKVLCFDRFFARSASTWSGVSPFAIAATSFFCAGRIRTHTLSAMMVPIIAPRCM